VNTPIQFSLASGTARIDMAKRVIATLALGFLSACGGAQPKAATQGPLDVNRLYPMRPGSVWTYDVDTGQGLPTLAITRVLGSDGVRTEVSS
jgi:hypothetical protein